jgi:hypothetical protein
VGIASRDARARDGIGGRAAISVDCGSREGGQPTLRCGFSVGLGAIWFLHISAVGTRLDLQVR